jgi:hypothetical protein
MKNLRGGINAEAQGEDGGAGSRPKRGAASSGRGTARCLLSDAPRRQAGGWALAVPDALPLVQTAG